PAVNLGAVTAADNCGTANKSHVSDAFATNGCVITVTRTYRAADACTNLATCQQIITVQDTTPPTITCPTDVNLGCNPASIPACNPSNAVATDNCGTPTVTCASFNGPTNGCVHYRTNVYTAIDACTNTATCRQVISWTEDTTPPTITCPADLDLGINPTSIPA